MHFKICELFLLEEAVMGHSGGVRGGLLHNGKNSSRHKNNSSKKAKGMILRAAHGD